MGGADAGEGTGVTAGDGVSPPAFSVAERASPLVMRPSLPDPAMAAGSSFCSVTIRCTDGESGMAAA